MQIPCHPIESERLVYVEVPKAGCTSIKWGLSPFVGGPPEVEDEIHAWFGYTHARDRGELDRWLASRWKDHFRFTVVRDPIARFESFFYGTSGRPAWGDINRYVLEELATPADPWRDDIHLVPQALIVGDLSLYDHVGRTHTLNQTARAVSAYLGRRVTFGHLNRSTAERQELSRAARARLRALYRADYERFGFR